MLPSLEPVMSLLREAWRVHMRPLCPMNSASFRMVYKSADVDGISESLWYGCTTPACESIHIQVNYTHNDTDSNSNNNKCFSNKKHRTQGDRTSELLEVIDNNGEVVFVITVTTHK
jgi:hypothetical protein